MSRKACQKYLTTFLISLVALFWWFIYTINYRRKADVRRKINAIKKNETFVSQYNDDFKDAVRFSVIDYGATVGTAKKMETKFSETIRVASQGYKLEAYMHGPYLEVNPEHRIFFIETPSPRLSKAKLLKAYESQYTEHVFAITKAQSIRP